jgi:hypothetical protein
VPADVLVALMPAVVSVASVCRVLEVPADNSSDLE